MSKRGIAVLGTTICALAFAGPAAAATVTLNDDNTGPGPAGATCAAPTFMGPDQFQAALAGAGSGGTVLVCAGTYNSGSSAAFSVAANITFPVTIRGAQAGVDARTRSTANESVLNDRQGNFVLQTGADNVTIDGFTTTGVWDQPTNSSYQAGIYTAAGVGGNSFINNIIDSNQFGMYLSSSAAKAANTVRHNVISSNNNTGPAGGNGIYGDFGTNHVAIDENRFFGNANSAIVINCDQSGGGNCPAPSATANSDLTITGNDMDNQIFLAGTSGSTVSGNSIHSVLGGVQLAGQNDGITISGNQITSVGDDFSAVRVASRFGFGTNKNVSITGNTMLGRKHESGVRVTTGGYTGGALPVHFNRIFGNQIGIDNQDPAIAVDAENNWFGCNEGPANGDCDSVVGSTVDFDPWLVFGLGASPTSVALGGQSTLTANLLKNSAGQTPAPNTFPSASVRFTSTAGSVLSPKPLSGAQATTTFTAPNTNSDVFARALFDGELAEVAIKVGTGSGGGGGGGTTDAHFVARPKRANLRLHPAPGVRLVCEGTAGTCAGKVAAYAKRKKGTAGKTRKPVRLNPSTSVSLQVGERMKLKLHLTNRGRRLVRKASVVRARLKSRPATGALTTIPGKITLRSGR